LRFSQPKKQFVAILSIDFEPSWRHFPAMSELVAWMLTKLAEDRSKTRSGLAEKIGVDKSVVTRIMAGDRQIKVSEISAIAEYFGELPPIGFSESPAPFAGPESAPPLAPVFRAAGGDNGAWLLHRHAEPIDWRPRGPHFERAATVLGFYAPDDAMAPRYKPGEIVWVDPHRPARAGEDALFVECAGKNGPERVILGELMGAAGGDHLFIQHKDRQEKRVRAQRWSALHVVPRY
jgi:transcriptional regulator with XRE-family HTH domain